MGKPTSREPIRGESAHVGDCYVWAEINYLDSPTDYREYLPQARTWPPAALLSQLIMLESDHSTRRVGRERWTVWGIVVLFLSIAGLFLYAGSYWYW